MQAIKPNDPIDYVPLQRMAARWHLSRPPGKLPTVASWQAMEDPLAAYRIKVKITPPLVVTYEEVGAALERLWGQPLRGKQLDKLYNEWFRKKAYEAYRLMVEQKLPVYDKRVLNAVVKKLGFYKLHLPFGDEHKVTSGFTYIIPLDAAVKNRADWEHLVKETPWL